MIQKLFISLLLATMFVAAGCTWNPSLASKGSLAPAKPKATKRIKTTAYTHSERSHRRYGHRNAIGGRLQSGVITSASADWSRYPVGTKFRIKETGKVYIIDDYGSALVGTDTIDLYKTTTGEMRRWGVRQVEIEVIEWGSFEKSLDILRDRQRNRHVRVMVAQLKQKTQKQERPGGPTDSTLSKVDL